MRQFSRTSVSVFHRFIAYFLLTITPICLIAITLYNWQIRALDQATVAAFESDTRHRFANLENELAKVKALSLSSLLDEDLILLSNASQVMSDYQKVVSINRYIRRLETLKNSSGYIQSISTYIPSLNRVIDDQGKLTADPGPVLRIYEAYKQQSSWAFSVDGDRLYYVFLPRGANIKTDTFTSLLVVQLSKSRMLEEISSVAGVESFVLGDDYYAYADYAKTSEPDRAPAMEAHLRGMPADSPSPVKGDEGDGWIVRHQSADTGLGLAAYLPVREVNPQMRELRGYFILFSVAIVLTVFVLTLLAARLFKKPLGKLVSAFGEVERGNMGLQLHHPRNDEFRYIYRSFNEMMARMKDLLERVFQHRILEQRAQLKQLQSQINPHFLYNSFYVIQGMARLQDYESIKRFTEYLGQYYQYITRKQSDEIRFAEEVEHSKVYADIQKMRFGERLNVRFGDVPPEAANVRVPRLILQPLVENAFEHGLRHRADEGILQVQCRMDDGKLIVCVEDNGEISDADIAGIMANLERTTEEVGGMANIHRRLQLHYGEESGIAASRSALGGLKITMTIREVRHV